MSRQPKPFFEFGPFRLIPGESLLLRDGRPVALSPKGFELLATLVRRSGSLVGKDELLKEVWPDAFVEEANLSRHVYALRRALGDVEDGQGYIETVPKRGYRFIADVKELTDNCAELVVEGHTRTHITIEEEVEFDAIVEPSVEQRVLSPVGETKGHPVRKLTRTVVIVLALVSGLAVAMVYLRSGGDRERAPGLGGVKTIAVLPFKPMGAGVRDEYLGLGMADALITKLSNVRQFVVRPTSAVRKFDREGQDAVAAGHELRVEAVLDGRVQRAGDHIRVTVQLLRVIDGAPLWAEKFDAKYTDVFAVHDSISEQVAGALTVEMSSEERRRLKKRHTDDTVAYQYYIMGRHHWNQRSRDNIGKAAVYFRQAVEIDPNYALAHAGLADTYNLFDEYDLLPPKESFLHARAAAVRALEIDETLAEAHASLAFVMTHYDWDWAGAEREFQRAVELSPNYATAHHWYAYYLILQGQNDKALAEIKRAREIDPLSLIINTDVGEIMFYSRRYDEAIEQFKKVLEMDPNFSSAHRRLWKAYEQKGNFDEAFAMFLKFWEGWGRSQKEVKDLRESYAASGWTGVQQQWLKQRLTESKHSYVPPFSLAGMYLRLGKRDEAFEMLEKAYAEHSSGIIYLKVEPVFDSLRSDPRYLDLLRRVGLAA